jgi:hypothetical protein
VYKQAPHWQVVSAIMLLVLTTLAGSTTTLGIVKLLKLGLANCKGNYSTVATLPCSVAMCV